MQLYYFHGRNFGDELNDWLWTALLGTDLDRRPDLHLSVIGTILSDKMPLGRNWAVLGSGVGYRPPPADFNHGDQWNILAVRGPLTAAALSIDPGLAGTDAAILLATLPECAPVPESQRSGIVYMPHLAVRQIGAYRAACAKLGIRYLDPTESSRETIQVLRHSSLVIADAMHAAIVADTLRVPWIPVASSRQINSFKWLDWTLSLGLEYAPTLLPAPIGRIRWQNRTAGLLGRKYLLDVNNRDTALRDYEKRQRFERNKLVDLALTTGRSLGKTLLGRSARTGGAPGIPAPAHAPDPAVHNASPQAATPSAEADAIADILQSLLGRAPYLSQDAAFAQKLKFMQEKLDAVRHL